jgi:flagellin-like hook-associated protein FlgL
MTLRVGIFHSFEDWLIDNIVHQQDKTINNYKHAITQLATGLRIFRAADDASDLMISDWAKQVYSSLNPAIRNIRNGIKLLRTTDDALSNIYNIALKIKELIIEASGKSESERRIIQSQINELVRTIRAIIEETDFDGFNLLKGDPYVVHYGPHKNHFLIFNGDETFRGGIQLLANAGNKDIDASVLGFSGLFKDMSDNMITVGSAHREGTKFVLTPNENYRRGAIWSEEKVNLRHDFTLTAKIYLGDNPGGADGITFTIQNSPDGTHALGWTGGNLGYAVIPNSIAVEFDTFKNGGEINGNHIAFDINGKIDNQSLSAYPLPEPLENGKEIPVTIQWEYLGDDKGKLKVTIFNRTYEQVYENISHIFGGYEAYIGFTGATGGLKNLQYVKDITFYEGSFKVYEYEGVIPQKVFISLEDIVEYIEELAFQTVGSAYREDDKYILTPNENYKAGAIWSKEKIDLRQNFILTAKIYLGDNPEGADGMTFTIQNQGPDALGWLGGGLGYGGLQNSIAVEFDTFKNSGEINGNHIGFDLNGQIDTNSLSVYPLPQPLESGKEIPVTIQWEYLGNDKGKLKVTIFGKTYEQVYENISHIFGGYEAYIGFTGATGSLKNLQYVRDIKVKVKFKKHVPPIYTIQVTGSESQLQESLKNIEAFISKLDVLRSFYANIENKLLNIWRTNLILKDNFKEVENVVRNADLASAYSKFLKAQIKLYIQNIVLKTAFQNFNLILNMLSETF